MVLLHSFLCSIEMWRPQIAPLAEHYTVIAVDFPGHGRSSPSTSHSLYDLVDDVVGLLDTLQVKRAVWCGLSMGGMVTMRAALTVPDRVRAIALLDTDGGRERPRLRIENRALSILARVTGIRPIIPRVLEKMFCDHTLRTQPDLVQAWSTHFLNLHLPSVRHSLSALSGRDDVLNALKTLSCPALVLHGDQDRALPPRCGDALAAAIPNAHHVVIERSGHIPTLEVPEQTTSALLSFWQRPWIF